ncbi:hypothetical protein BJ875DRAFT_157625 [Amylocarpus encephaloides]|uniref:Uncharacterized protein n=1 Tax=Amylocarpus encephaloides TaxID=45428 RepID=A0A9P7YCD1_9HELO|nr:hypothetical protein BJ875DRAFT_157625 [Amylocarpus encephaloides]
MARGDDALAGKPEKDIPSHRFPPDPNNDRTINFKGKYILIVNEETNDQKTFEDNKIPTAESKPYEVPARYTCYIRGASVWFRV